MFRIDYRAGGQDYWHTIATAPCRVCADHIAAWWRDQRPETEVRIEQFIMEAEVIERQDASAV